MKKTLRYIKIYKNIEKREKTKLNYTRSHKLSQNEPINKRLNEKLEHFEKDRIISKIPSIT